MNREQWLTELAAHMGAWFVELGCPLPKIRMSCGFTSAGRRGRRIGECWTDKASADNTHEIFIHPQVAEPIEAAAVLAHELTHAAVGLAAKHGKPFKRVVSAIGLIGRVTATQPGPAFIARMESVLAQLPPYPHAPLNAGSETSSPPKQDARLLKSVCPVDGYTLRVSTKWASQCPPVCPLCLRITEVDWGERPASQPQPPNEQRRNLDAVLDTLLSRLDWEEAEIVAENLTGFFAQLYDETA